MKKNKELCLLLAKSETEAEVISALKKFELWENNDLWRDYGDNENNFSTIGNQQSSAEAALVEKLINSVDAVLMRECLVRGINPESNKAPQSLEEALSNFFDIYKGKLSNIDARIRTSLADNIHLIATGEKQNPCYAILDRGEGQTPQNFPKTLLSIGKSNKLRIPFVQGRFNMGATGALQFCGKQNLQLIISKRNPDIDSGGDDHSKDKWGFTIVKRVEPSGEMRNSVYRYLAPNDGEVLQFSAKSLPIAPDDYPEPYGKPLRSGTYVKLYEYDLKGLKTNLKFDPYYRLSLMLPDVALPIMLYERRKGYRGRTHRITMSGLSVRLEEDKGKNLEDNFPNSSDISVLGEEMEVQIYAFKKSKESNYAPSDGVIFTVNGQTHGTLSRRFFARKNVQMSYLRKSILLIVDCTKLKPRTREDLFMNSRDRLREGAIRSEIERELESLVNSHPGLRELRERRRREEIQGALEDSRPLADVINNVIKNSPTLTELFIKGVEIQNPLNLSGAGVGEKYKGKKYPTFFKLTKEYPKNKPKPSQKDRRFRVKFETDVTNDYLKRNMDPGNFKISLNGSRLDRFSLNLWNGTATLNVSLPEDANEGDSLFYKTELTDPSRVEPFVNNFYVEVVKQKDSGGGNGERKKPTDPDEKGESDYPSTLSLPNIKECRKSDGEDYRFKDDEEAALEVLDAGEGGYDFFINMDNKYLKTEQKGSPKIDPELLNARFKYGMVLVGLACLTHDEKRDGEEDENGTIYDKIYFFTKALAPMLLPMIASLGDIKDAFE